MDTDRKMCEFPLGYIYKHQIAIFHLVESTEPITRALSLSTLILVASHLDEASDHLNPRVLNSQSWSLKSGSSFDFDKFPWMGSTRINCKMPKLAHVAEVGC